MAIGVEGADVTPSVNREPGAHGLGLQQFLDYGNRLRVVSIRAQMLSGDEEFVLAVGTEVVGHNSGAARGPFEHAHVDVITNAAVEDNPGGRIDRRESVPPCRSNVRVWEAAGDRAEELGPLTAVAVAHERDVVALGFAGGVVDFGVAREREPRLAGNSCLAEPGDAVALGRENEDTAVHPTGESAQVQMGVDRPEHDRGEISGEWIVLAIIDADKRIERGTGHGSEFGRTYVSDVAQRAEGAQAVQPGRVRTDIPIKHYRNTSAAGLRGRGQVALGVNRQGAPSSFSVSRRAAWMMWICGKC